jgi:sterol-4alpha-carboxylate 3-dehydrogenase (decarboxylating)
MAPKSSNASLGCVLVTGGCGLVGHHIVSLIVERYPGSTVAGLDLRTTHRRIDSSKVSYHDGDICDLGGLRALFQKIKPDVVIHTAAAIADSSTPDALMYKINVDGTKHLLTAAKESGVKAFVYTSSSSVIIGDVKEVINADESWPILTGKEQPEFYTATKVSKRQ